MKTLFIFLFVSMSTLTALAVDIPQQPFIHVSGHAEKFVKPDNAVLSFTVKYSDKNYQKGYDKIQNKTNEIIKRCIEKSILISNIETFEIHVYENKDYNKNVIRFYSFRRPFVIKLNSLKNISSILDELHRFKISGSISSKFDILNRNEIEKELLKKAIENSKTKAKQLANLYGSKLNGVLAISESSLAEINNIFIPNRTIYFKNRVQLEAGAMLDERSNRSPKFLIPREIKLTNTINVIFSLSD